MGRKLDSCEFGGFGGNTEEDDEEKEVVVVVEKVGKRREVF